MATTGESITVQCLRLCPDEKALCGFGWMSDNSALQCIGASEHRFARETSLLTHPQR